jgi:hypothetical protein
LKHFQKLLEAKKDSTIKEMESERDHLFQQIGKLQVEVD